MSSPEHRDAADRMLALAGRVLPPGRREWHEAMWAELAQLSGDRERRGFALSCLRASFLPNVVLGVVEYLLIVAGAAALARADGARGAFAVIVVGAGIVAPPVIWRIVRRDGFLGAVAAGRAARLCRRIWFGLAGVCVVIAVEVVAVAMPREGGAVDPAGAALSVGIAFGFLFAYTLVGLALTSKAARVPGGTLAVGLGSGAVGGVAWTALMPFDQTLATHGRWPTVLYAVALGLTVVVVPGAAAVFANRRSDQPLQGVVAGLSAGLTAGFVMLAGGWTLVWLRPALLYSSTLDKGPQWRPPEIVEQVITGYLFLLFLAPFVGMGIGWLAGENRLVRSRVWVAVPVLSAAGALVFPMLQAVIVDDTTTFAGVGTTRVDFPSSGDTILTSNGDQTFVLWGMADPARPRRLATFSGDARYSPDGHLLASRDTLWSLDGAARPTRLGRFTEGVPAAFSADGRMLLVHDRNATTLWNVVDPRHPVRLAGLGRATSDATFAPDGRTLYTSDVNGNTITRWDLRDPDVPVPVAVVDGWQALVSPDGGTLVVSQLDGDTVLWDATGVGQPVRRAAIGDSTPFRRFAFSPDGRILAAGGDDNSVELYRLPDGDKLAALPPVAGTVVSQVGASDPLTAFAFAPDGRTLSVVVGNTSLSVWDVSRPVAPVRVRTAGRPTSGPGVVAFSPDTTVIAGSAALGINSVTFWKVD